jgi:acyl-homoserine-lactone acylase
LFKDELLEQACATPMVEGDVVPLAGTGTDAATQHPRTRTVDVSHACEVLRGWSNRADAADRGALLWDAFWARLRKLPSRTLYAVPFSSDAPLDTPRSPRSRDGNVARALATAVLQLEEKRVALDAPLASRRFVDSGGQRLPMYGGCPSAGYFVVACSADRVDELGPNAMANSYLQVVHFGAAGVEAHTLLAHGQDEAAVVRGAAGTDAAAVTGSIRAPVARYARKDWLRFPFRESDIAVDPGLTRTVLKP